MRIIRVFPRQTKATPTDALAIINRLPSFFDVADEVHISVAFSWDLPLAESLAKQWGVVAPVLIGGPATGQRSEGFVPGMYIQHGYTITSRGCPNRCWFCNVWRREGDNIRELPIVDGHNILDDNLLACSEAHIRAVFAMLQRQKQRAVFTGGFEARRLKPWHCELLADLKPARMFFAYDTPDDYEPLITAGKLLQQYGFGHKNRTTAAYVLCGYPKDTFDSAEQRMHNTIAAGFMPMAMLYRDKKGARDPEWQRWARLWARPAIIYSKIKQQAGQL